MSRGGMNSTLISAPGGGPRLLLRARDDLGRRRFDELDDVDGERRPGSLFRLFRGTIARAREDATQTVEVATLELAHAAPRLELARALVLEKHVVWNAARFLRGSRPSSGTATSVAAS